MDSPSTMHLHHKINKKKQSDYVLLNRIASRFYLITPNFFLSLSLPVFPLVRQYNVRALSAVIHKPTSTPNTTTPQLTKRILLRLHVLCWFAGAPETSQMSELAAIPPITAIFGVCSPWISQGCQCTYEPNSTCLHIATTHNLDALRSPRVGYTLQRKTRPVSY